MRKFGGIAAAVLLLVALTAQTVQAQDFAGRGERYLFEDAQGSNKPYLVLKLGNESRLIVITGISRDFGIVEGVMMMEPFNDYFTVPSWASSTGRAVTIRHVNNDIYVIGSEYVKMKRAPAGFWTNAHLELGR